MYQQRRRAETLLFASLMTILSAAASAHADADAPEHRVELSVGGSVGLPRGYVQVRENQTSGDRLHLHGDLGIDTMETVDLGVAYHLTPLDTLRLSGQWTFLYGSARPREDVSFNGATLQGGSSLDSRPEFFRATALYDRILVELGNRGELAADVGFTYVLLNYKLQGTLAAATRGHETTEDFLAQELPVPVLGLRTMESLNERLRLVGSLLGGYLPRVDSLRSEGGAVKLSQSHVDLDAGVEYLLTPALAAQAGYRFTYFTQHETSREDGNDFQLWANALSVAIAYRF